MSKIMRKRDLRIASGPINPYKRDQLQCLNYDRWKEFINQHDCFVWYQDTAEAKKLREKVETMPEDDDFRQRILASFNYLTACSSYNPKKDMYEIFVSFHNECNWITIYFEKVIRVDDLKLFLKMAEYLDALLLVDLTKVIDRKKIEEMEKG